MVPVHPMKVYSQLKYEMDIPYLEDPPWPSSTKVSSICNPRYAFNVAWLVVSVSDRQYLMVKTTFESLKYLVAESM